MESTYWNVRYIIVGQITETVMIQFYKIAYYNKLKYNHIFAENISADM